MIPTFVQLLQDLSKETEKEVMLRRFAKQVGHQAINLRAELSNHDTSRNGKLEKQPFKRAMRHLPLSLSDSEIESLYSFTQQHGTVDIKDFVAAVTAASKTKPPPQQLTIQSKPGSKVQARGATQGTTNSAFENWELEKKYKKNLEALK